MSINPVQTQLIGAQLHVEILKKILGISLSQKYLLLIIPRASASSSERTLPPSYTDPEKSSMPPLSGPTVTLRIIGQRKQHFYTLYIMCCLRDVFLISISTNDLRGNVLGIVFFDNYLYVWSWFERPDVYVLAIWQFLDKMN